MDLETLSGEIRSLADLQKVHIMNAAGAVATRIGWVVSLFFDGGELIERRRDANAVLGDFLQSFAGRITHFHPSNSERLRPIGSEDLLAYSNQDAETATARSGRDGNDKYSADVYGFDGGREMMEPAPYYLGISTCDRQRRDPSSIVADITLAWPGSDDLSPVVDLLRRWCTLLRPAHGTLSPGLVFMQGGGGTELVSSFPLLQRFPGLDHVDASLWRLAARRQPRPTIRTIGWLTVLDGARVTLLGGAAAIRAALPEYGIVVHDIPDGLMIQAGPRPQLGDRNRGLVPDAYRAVARLLQPLVLDPVRRGMFRFLPQPLDPEAETTRWLHRFD